jgi:hypothetical protein
MSNVTINTDANGRVEVRVSFGVISEMLAMPVQERAFVIRSSMDTATELVADHLDRVGMERAGAQPRPGNLLPSATQSPSCRGCGTYVEKAGDICPVCIDKPQFAAPKATFEMGAQPDPAYRDGGPAVPRT